MMYIRVFEEDERWVQRGGELLRFPWAVINHEGKTTATYRLKVTVKLFPTGHDQNGKE